MAVPTLLITGTVGAGKSTVAAEINDVLAELKVPNAAVDLDALVWQWPSGSPQHVREARLLARMPPGESREWHLRRTAELEELLDARRAEDFVVENGGRPVRDVALEVLMRSGWIAPEAASSTT